MINLLLAPKEYCPGFTLSPTLEQKKKRVSYVDLQMPKEELVKKYQAVIIAHKHYKHWDKFPQKNTKQTLIFVQNASDKELIINQGFKDIRVVRDNTPFKGITITKTIAQYGDEMMYIPSWAKGLWDSYLKPLEEN